MFCVVLRRNTNGDQVPQTRFLRRIITGLAHEDYTHCGLVRVDWLQAGHIEHHSPLPCVGACALPSVGAAIPGITSN
jgi:hypothetical protein